MYGLPLYLQHTSPPLLRGCSTLSYQYTLSLHRFTTIIAECLLVSCCVLSLYARVHILSLPANICVSLGFGAS